MFSKRLYRKSQVIFFFCQLTPVSLYSGELEHFKIFCSSLGRRQNKAGKKETDSSDSSESNGSSSGSVSSESGASSAEKKPEPSKSTGGTD